MDLPVTAIRPDTHFDFGRNWADYAPQIDDFAVSNAEKGLSRIGLTDIRGQTFLDIGCGSGIQSLAAAQRGAIISAIDVDRESVDTTNATLKRAGLEPCAEQISVFDASPARLGQFDAVYSWGVLHHTGDVWRAIDCAAALVKPGGKLAIALYERTPLCRAWKLEKRVYKALGPIMRFPIKAGYGTVMLLAQALRIPTTPRAYLNFYADNRGMSFWHDIDDWLGGYPYEPVSTDEVIGHLEGRGFTLWKTTRAGGGIGLLGTGCSEFLFHAGP